MRVLRRKAEILLTVVLLGVSLLLLAGCGEQTQDNFYSDFEESYVPTETFFVQEAQAVGGEEKQYPILSVSVRSQPVTKGNGEVWKTEGDFLNFISLCYKKEGKIEFLTLSLEKRDKYADYWVQCAIGEENRLVMTWPMKGNQQVANKTIYKIYLTEETYQTIYQTK